MLFVKYKDKRAGFSIIEIAIVLMIAGLIISGALVGYKFYQNQQVSTTQSRLNTLDMILNQYNDDIGEYPEDLDELISGPKDENKAKKFQKVYVKKEDELKSAWGTRFEYSKNPKGSATPYTLSAYNKILNKPMYSNASE